ncbi:MAG: cyclodeaminase/cyclohydrolase family protein [Candidatus Omnitrophota bacterium]|nr:cyclodeaminase/cyclohydrolase family protein [Candidatus Omnitrophota bacterium]
MYNDMLKEYLDDLASKKPAPGGGSVAALTGALGVSLISMVAHFSKGVTRPVLDIRSRLIALIDEDVLAFEKVMQAYKMPRENSEQISERTRVIQKSLKAALSPPLNVCLLCYEAIKICKSSLLTANINLISDVGVSAVLLEGAFYSAYLNVKINLKYLKDKKIVKEVKQTLEPLAKEIIGHRRAIYKEVSERMDEKK